MHRDPRPNRPGGTRIPPGSKTRESDPERFERLVQEHERRILTIALQMCGNIDDARDIAQDTFLRAFRSRRRLRRDRPPGPWLNRIAVNSAIDFLRKRRAADALPLEEGDGHVGSRSGRGPVSPVEARILDQEESERLFSLLSRLAPRERAAFVLRHLQGLSTEETARSMGCTRVTVRRHTSRARQKLRRALSEGQEMAAGGGITPKRGEISAIQEKTPTPVERSRLYLGSNK